MIIGRGRPRRAARNGGRRPDHSPGARSGPVVLVVALLMGGGVLEVHAQAPATDTVDDVRARVVRIDSVFDSGADEQGAGLVIGVDEGSLLVVTAAHVIQDRSGAAATGTRTALPWSRDAVDGITLLDADARLDVAFLTVDAPNLAAAVAGGPLLCHRDARPDEPVTTVGHRLGELWVVGRGDRVLSTRLGADTRRFTITASGVGPGNSGGPVLGEDGCLLGIVTDRDANEARVVGIRQVLALLDVQGRRASLLGGESPLDRRRRGETFAAVGRLLNGYLFAVEAIPALLRRSRLDADEIRQTIEAYNRAYAEVYSGRAGMGALIGDQFGARRGTDYLALVARLDTAHKTIVYSRLNDVVTSLRVSGRLTSRETRDLQRALADLDRAIPPLRTATDEFLAQLQPLVGSLTPP